MEQPPAEPSIFWGSLAGYALATVIATVGTVWMSLQVGRANATGSFQILTGSSAMGAVLGYVVAVRRRKARGFVGPNDTWATFVSSGTFSTLGGIVIAGSGALALLIKKVFDALA